MLNQLINSILSKQLIPQTLSLLLIYIQNKKIITFTSLIDNLFKEYVLSNNQTGYLYCIHNKVYEYYGKNVHKLGRSKNVEKRIISYITGYIDPIELKYKSPLLNYHDIAESILFNKLSKYRLSHKREFFDCDVQEIILTIIEIENEIKTINILDLMDKYQIATGKQQIFKNNLIKILTAYENQLSKVLVNDIDKLKINTVPIINKYDKLLNAIDITTDVYNLLKTKSVDALTQNEIYEIENLSRPALPSSARRAGSRISDSTARASASGSADGTSSPGPFRHHHLGNSTHRPRHAGTLEAHRLQQAQAETLEVRREQSHVGACR